MKKFFYRVREAESGALSEGCIQADTIGEAADYLRRERYLIIELKNYDFAAVGKYILRQYKNRKINADFWIILCRQLSVLLDSGLNITDAFEILRGGAKNAAARDFFSATLEGLKRGGSLSGIWKELKINAPPYVIGSLIVAEHTGMTAMSLNEASKFLRKVESERKKLSQICIYPAFLLIMLAVVCSVMIFFVLPVFAAVFQKMNAELPFLTRAVLFAGDFVKNNALYILAAGLALAAAAFRAWRKRDFQMKVFSILHGLPGIGDLLEKISLLQIGRQMVFLLSSGIDLDECLGIIVSSRKNAYTAERLECVRRDLNSGLSLHESFRRLNVRNAVFMGLLNVGEQTGLLADNLNFAVEFLEQDLDAFADKFMKLLEPVLMIAVGVVIGIFVLTVVLPLFSMAASIGM